MSFGDPNNPYGAPQGQQGYGQPGYGQPQQPGYGYPAAPPVGGYAPQAPTSMPGTVSTARILLWIIVGFQVLGTALFSFAAVAAKKADEEPAFEQLKDTPPGQLWALAALALVWGVWAAFLAAKFSSGGNGLRVTTLVFGILTAIIAVFPFTLAGIIHLVFGILIAVFAGNSNGKAWFNRPRY
ncbi:hypothetical protein [Streptomyces sp. NPDC058739]|uniref:hypothetical protein n=1 Tax=Streptomyces sp. NPDC058739 TaxID=3346618 RepID=UPI0036A34C65